MNTKINTKKFALTALAVFIFMTIFDMIVHGFLLADLYLQTPALWRTEADVNMLSMMIVGLVMSLFLTCLFVKMNVRTVKQGALAGLSVGLPFALAAASMYVYMPLPAGLACAWFVATLIEIIGVGKITGLIYKD